MDGEVELSVIVPVYNTEKYLERCLDSILSQTYEVGEIVCVDDGSTDSSGKILDRYACDDKRFKIIHKENGGLVNARKTGLLSAKGTYIAYVDSDDWIDHKMYEKMIEIMRKTDADIVVTETIRDYGKHQVIENIYIPEGVYEGERLKRDLLGNLVSVETFFQSNISVVLCNKLFKREHLLPYQMNVHEELEMGEDLACCYPCMLDAERIAVTHDSYYHYCIRKESMAGTRKDDEGKKMEILFQALHKEFFRHLEVPNIMQQFMFLKYQYLLLRQPEEVLSWEDGLLFPFGRLGKRDKVVIYGAGRFGGELKKYLEKRGADIVAWVDENDSGEVKEPQCLQYLEFDKVIIAVLRSEFVEQIKKKLIVNVEEKTILSIDARLLSEKSGRECEYI